MGPYCYNGLGPDVSGRLGQLQAYTGAPSLCQPVSSSELPPGILMTQDSYCHPRKNPGGASFCHLAPHKTSGVAKCDSLEDICLVCQDERVFGSHHLRLLFWGSCLPICCALYLWVLAETRGLSLDGSAARCPGLETLLLSTCTG